TVRLLRSGDRIDVVAADSGGETRVVATAARVSGDCPLSCQALGEFRREFYPFLLNGTFGLGFGLIVG
ncbi:hypothetical protein ABZU45_41480, partial [Streptomyces avermitilis]